MDEEPGLGRGLAIAIPFGVALWAVLIAFVSWLV
jgi:hypothetical protein